MSPSTISHPSSPMPTRSSLSARTQAATVNYVKSLGRQLRAKGMRVDAVAPSPMWTQLPVSGGSGQPSAESAGQSPLGWTGASGTFGMGEIALGAGSWSGGPTTSGPLRGSSRCFCSLLVFTPGCCSLLASDALVCAQRGEPQIVAIRQAATSECLLAMSPPEMMVCSRRRSWRSACVLRWHVVSIRVTEAGYRPRMAESCHLEGRRTPNSASIPSSACQFSDVGKRLVEPSGIEPLTSCMPCKRSPS